MPATDRRFRACRHVLSTRTTDAVVLLDRKRGTYHTLNEVGGRVWELIGEGVATDGIVHRLLEEYDVPRSRLEQDVSAMVSRLIEARLVAPLPAATTEELQAPSVVWCGILVAWIKTLLRLRGFLATLEWIRRRVDTVPASTEAPLEQVRAVESAVAMAGALYPGRAKCLEQSLALYYLLRRQGVAVAYCQGVQPYPFRAHAWVEYRGQVINDVPEHARFFARLPEQLP
jgi:hypothetical protein